MYNNIRAENKRQTAEAKTFSPVAFSNWRVTAIQLQTVNIFLANSPVQIYSGLTQQKTQEDPNLHQLFLIVYSYSLHLTTINLHKPRATNTGHSFSSTPLSGVPRLQALHKCSSPLLGLTSKNPASLFFQ